MPLKKKKKAVSKKKVLRRKIAKKSKAVRKKKPVLRKKPLKKKASKRKSSAKSSRLKEGVIGVVTHYFPQVRAGVIKLNAPLAVGDSIRVKGHTTDFTQEIASMQIDRAPIQQAKKGDEIGILVKSRVRRRDLVYKL